MIMNILTYVLIGTQVLTFLIGVGTAIFAKIKNKDYKFTNDELQKINEMASKIVPNVIETIESMYPNATAEVKKSAAMDKLSLYALKNNIAVTEDYISSMIEDLIALTKKVNVSRETDKTITGATNYGRR